MNGLYLLGMSRSGKSNQLRNIGRQLLEQRIPFCLFDIEGGLYDYLACHAPLDGSVRLLNPSDDSLGVIPMNLLAGPYQGLHTRVQALLSVFRRAWPDSFDSAARMRAILTSGFMALGEAGYSLANFDRLILDPTFAGELAANSARPELLTFWTDYRPKLRGAFLQWIESSRNKIFDLLASPYLGPSLQADSCINLFEKTTLIRLDESKLQDHLRLFATIFLALVELQSAERPELSEPFFLLLDEMQEYPSDGIHRLISRRQKRGLGVIAAHQNVQQIDPRLLSDIIGNCEHRMIFKLGDIKDAIWAAEQVFELTGDRVKHQKTERVWGIFKIEVGDPTYWSRSDEHVHFARELQLQQPGQCVYHRLSSGKAYYATVPFCPDVPGAVIPESLKEQSRMLSPDDIAKVRERNAERMAELGIARKRKEIATKRAVKQSRTSKPTS
jgi:DNA helicase HerA-like ATPase